MAWAINILKDPYLPTICEWDAVELEKFDGKKWVPFVHELWTGTHMWNVQVSDALQFQIWSIDIFCQTKLSKDGKLLCITLYADKTCLSLFGTAQGYLIMGKINNLPHNI